MAVSGGTDGWPVKLFRLADIVLRAVSRHPLAACCLIGFLSGALLDLDHVPRWLFHVRYPVLVPVAGPHPLVQGRNLHGLALVVGGLAGAYAGGSVLLLVLGRAIAMVRTIVYARVTARTNRVTEK